MGAVCPGRSKVFHLLIYNNRCFPLRLAGPVVGLFRAGQPSGHVPLLSFSLGVHPALGTTEPWQLCWDRPAGSSAPQRPRTSRSPCASSRAARAGLTQLSVCAPLEPGLLPGEFPAASPGLPVCSSAVPPGPPEGEGRVLSVLCLHPSPGSWAWRPRASDHTPRPGGAEFGWRAWSPSEGHGHGMLRAWHASGMGPNLRRLGLGLFALGLRTA